MKQLKAASLITAIKTPYLDNGDIDLNTYDWLVKQQIAAGVDGIIVGGTTGEGHLLSWDEHVMLIAHSTHKYGNKLLIIGNTGSNNTREAIKATQYGFAIGMDAALQINPYYGKTSDQGVVEHFNKVLALGPAIIYNVPSRTGQDLTPDIIEQIADHKNFVGMKECAGIDRIAYYEKNGIACWSGNDDESFVSRHEHGSHGVISVTSNLMPVVMRQLMDDKNATELNKKAQPLIDWLFCEPNPIAINTALMMTNAVKKNFRLPYRALTQEQQKQGVEHMAIFEQSQLLVGSKPTVIAEEDINYCD